MEIWANEAHTKHTTESQNEADTKHTTESQKKLPTVLVFGFAGSHKNQIMPFNELYNRFGYSTISCILPCEYLFHYDIPKIHQCADAVIDRLQKENIDEVVIHTLSGNGAALYQHFNQRIEQQKKLEIKGAIFDSGPNPMAWLAQLPIGLEKVKFMEKSRIFLHVAHLGTMLSNERTTFGDMARAMVHQHRELSKNWKLYKSTPWNGQYMLDVERKTWPLLFLFSKTDLFVNFRFVRLIAETHRKRGRQVSTTEFPLKLTRYPNTHVAHLKLYPDMYSQDVHKFLKSL